MGKTKRGKGSKRMAGTTLANRFGLPLAVCAASAAPHEVTRVAATLDSRFVGGLPERLIGDRAYDADALDEALPERGVELIAPHRRNRKRPKTQDGRPLRRYKRRWKIECLFAWLSNFRRLLVRHERHALNYLGFVHLGCSLILLRQGVEMTSSAHGSEVRALGLPQICVLIFPYRMLGFALLSSLPWRLSRY